MTPIERFWAKTKIAGNCLVWTGAAKPSGYGVFQIGNAARPRTARAHRWIYEHSIAKLGKVALRHSCDTPACVKLQHLEPGTQKQNLDEMRARNRGPLGERHGMAKLSDDQVTEIRRLASLGLTHTDIASRFGVSRSNVGRIVNMKQRKPRAGE